MNTFMNENEAREELRRVYEELDAEIVRLAPRCELSGRCCRFKEYDHTLFLSTIEADFLLSESSFPARPLDDGATCPWQDASGRCTAPKEDRWDVEFISAIPNTRSKRPN